MRVAILVPLVAACAALGCGRSHSAIVPVVAPAELRSIADAEGSFAVRLIRQLSDDKPGANVMVGPDSILSALALAASGANGATRDQILAALTLPPATDAPLDAVAALRHRLLQAADADGIELSIVNRLWVERTMSLAEPWTRRIGASFDDAFESIDFARDPEASRETINAFVADATNDKILDLMPAGSIDGLTRIVITNATWFKGSWAEEFDRDLTRPAPFTKRDGSKVDAPFMTQKDRFPFAKFDDGVAAELPYEGGELAMLIVVPDDIASVRTWQPTEFAQRAQKLVEREIVVLVPRFTFRCSYALVPTLQSFGMTDAFDARLADFERMSAVDDLFVTSVHHQTFIEVNEEGTEAAAATGVGVALTAAVRTDELRADRPFVFAIRHRPTGAVLFAGIVEDPTKS